MFHNRKCTLLGALCFAWVSFSSAQIAFPPSSYNNYESGGLPETIKIGGLFDEADPSAETAFKHAVERVNEESNILPRSRLSTQIERLSPGDSFHASNKVCNMMREGIAAIFGPQSPEAASHVQSICDAFEIPHIETKWDYRIRKENYLINLYPHPITLSRAFNDLVEAWEWKKYVILYENNESLFKLQDLIKSSVPPQRQALLKQLPEGDDYRPLLKDISRSTDITNIIIDCAVEKIPDVLKQAQQVGMMTFHHSYIITSLDIHTIDLEDFKYGDINITAYRIVDPDKPEVQTIVRQWNSLTSTDTYAHRSPLIGPYHYSTSSDQRYGRRQGFQDVVPATELKMISTETALVYDAVLLFGKALHVLDSSQRIDIRPLNCDSDEMWQHGYSIINYMKMVQLQGLTGLIQFNTTGFRTDVQMDVVKLTQNGLNKIGTWDSKFVTKFNWTRPEGEEAVVEDESMDLQNRTLIVTTIMNDPFCMLKRSIGPLKGNDQYEGYNIDLLKKLSERLGFKYIIRVVGDKSYGSPKNNQWNGMIKEIMDGVADIAVADLTINKDRQEAVDFTMPFMNLGISILFTVPMAKPPSLFSFMSPFSLDVWIYMSFAFFGVSIILFILARLTPYEWDNPHPCIEDPDELENQFTLLNSFWFTIGSIMQQGSDIAPKISPYEWVIGFPCRDGADPEYINDLTFSNSVWLVMSSLLRQKSDVIPKAVSTRMIAGIWWFFTLIMVSSYTANLATFLIVQDLDESIKSLSDLPKQNRVKYGCVKTGTTASFFKNSPFEEKRLIWNKMLSMKPDPFMDSNSLGLERVLAETGRYAFFMESTVIEYYIERKCGLAQVGGLLDSKGYGIALPKNSKYRQAFSSGILHLQEKGVLDELKRKWWKEERKETSCSASGGGGDVQPLRLANVGGVFVVLVFGCIVAIVLAFMEFFYKSRELANNEGESLFTEMAKELKFALQCRGDTKPVKKKNSLTNENGSGNGNGNGNTMGSNQYLDLGIDSYGFPKVTNRSNGGANKDGYT